MMTQEQLAQLAAVIIAPKIWDVAEQYEAETIARSVRIARAIWAELHKPQQ